MRVFKFGGSSLCDAEAIGRVIDILQEKSIEEKPLCVVVSAMGGVTDEIIRTAKAASHREIAYRETLKALRKRHTKVLNAIAHGDRETTEIIQEQCVEFFGICDGVYALGELSGKVLDRLMSFGELCSAHMVAAACRHAGLDAKFVDSRDYIVTDERYGAARVDFEKTAAALHKLDADGATIHVLPGFVARSANGRITTLGRNGSDYSAAIIGAGLGASAVEIWTDVNGVMTANPRYVSDAESIERMSYVEAMELSHFGAHVLHAPTLQPVMEKTIPLLVRNTFSPDFKGTIVGNESVSERIITGISTVDNVSFIRVQGSGMVGVFGVAGRLFTSLAKAEVNLIMISQGSSEHSICFAVQDADNQKAVQAIETEFELEMQAHMMDTPVVEREMCVLAVVGENMRRRPGIAANVFGSLGESGVNVVAIAQGSSELNISMVILQQDASKALNAIHSAFFKK
ncbi:MAG: aspartate kinase [Deltaproteobacteria bacterium]|nr:aspartate kinase [Deltaproteobacteria bacterium]